MKHGNLIILNRTSALLLVLVFVASLTTSGCFTAEKKAAQDLVKTGSSTSDQLAKFYDGLGEDAQQTHQMILFERVRERKELVSGSGQSDSEFKQLREALAARAQMARAMKAVYEALGKLIDYDAAGEVSGAVVNLKKEIESVSKKKLPNVGVDPVTVLQKATEILATWIQLKEFHKQSPKAEQVLDCIETLVNRESVAYVRIIKLFDANAFTTAQFFIENDLAEDSSLYEKPFDLFDGMKQASPAVDCYTDYR